MSLGQHLLELRKRLFLAAGGVLAGAVAGWFLSDFVLTSLRAPLEQIAKSQHRLALLNYDNVTGSFDLKLQIAIMIGVVISCPIWLYQIWAFFLPGLNKRERQYGLGFFLTAVPLFFAGCAAGWFVFPHIVQLLASFGTSHDAAVMQAQNYFMFALKLCIVVGVAFVLPVFLVMLNFIGILSAKAILKGWRIAMLAIVLFTAIATPSVDVFSMFLLAVPMIVLYFGAVGVATIHDRRAQHVANKIEADLTRSAGA